MIKGIFIILSFFSFFLSYSQSKLEQAVIKELNDYRKKYSLVTLVYDAKSSEMSKYHAVYLKKLNEYNYSPLDLNSNQVHDELIDLPNFKEMTFEERAKKVGADDFLTKPFQSIRLLVNKVTDLLTAKKDEENFLRPIENPNEPVSSFADTLKMEPDDSYDTADESIESPAAEFFDSTMLPSSSNVGAPSA